MIRLLIADDEMLERAVLYKILHKNLGDRCTIFQAENGREALGIYEKEKIQVAILDIEMPGINGIEAAQQIREKDKDCSIIFLTAFDEFAYARKAITVRALDYLLKPYEERELMLVVEEAVRLAEENQKKKRDSHPESRQAAGEPLAALQAEALWQEAEKEQAEGWSSEKGSGKETTAAIEELLPEEGREELENSRMSGVREVITRYIRENYMYDISMQELARRMNYSEAYFCKLFKQCFGQNFISYLTEYRVEEAKKRLKEPGANIKEISQSVGYGDSNYFTKVFRRVTGISPTEYRAQGFREKSQGK